MNRTIPEPTRKSFGHGTHRMRSPAATLSAVEPHLRRLGITRVANVTGLDTIGIPVYVAIRPNARTLATSQGKGLDPLAAKASATMEAVELWHAENVALPVRRATYLELCAAGAAVADPAALQLAAGMSFDPASPRSWVTGRDIVRGRDVLVPLDLVLIEPLDPASTFLQSTNGLASGNHPLEAIAHGLCEVIERDAEARWRASDDLRRVDPATVTEPYCRELLRRIEASGTVAALFDITSVVNVPAYTCMLIESPDPPRWRATGFYNGFGCHPSPAVALARAVTEAAQVRLTYISGSRDDVTREAYAESTDEAAWRQTWSEIEETPFSAEFGARASIATDSFEDDLEVLFGVLAAAGHDTVIAVDLSRADIGVPVVKVIVPGLVEVP